MDVGRNYPEELVVDEVRISRLGNTPVTVQGGAWFPVAQFLAWSLFSQASKQRNPGRSWLRAGVEGFTQMLVALGSEWGHNLAHLAASHWIGKPMDEFRIQLGMPRCVYRQINDTTVTPRQHIIRALGGPIFNLLVLPFAVAASMSNKKETIAGRTARTALHTNLFLSLVSLMPIPGIDGGPILKWTLVEKGRSVQEADEVVRKVNGPLALFLGLFSSLSFGKKKILPGFFSAMMSLTCLSIFAGWIKEEDIQV
jgi:hypothetical protein